MQIDKKLEARNSYLIPTNKMISSRVVTEANFMRAKNRISPNFIVCGSLTILAIVDSSSFSYEGEIHKNIASALMYQKISHQGVLAGYDVYLDFNMEPNDILIKYNLQADRNYKVGVILDGESSSDFIDTLKLEVVGLT